MPDFFLFVGKKERIAALALLAVASAPLARAQTAPLRETRGVWLATVLGDGVWPESPTDPAQKQENDLRDRIREVHALGLNTLVFQAVARGDAMYPSSRLPWSVRLGGAGVDPGYDPLSVAIDECHRLGMEFHAWFNTYRVGDTGTVAAFESVADPAHVYYENPGWVETRGSEIWLDPSSPDARSWLVANVMEIVESYDVDAVHFDFIRYPNGGLADDLARFQFDPRGFSDIDDWRRDNVSLFVEDVSAAIAAAKPWVAIGSAPFGNYAPFDGAWPAAWALTDVFQESRRWLADGRHDYVAPQIYFDIGREPEPPNTYDSPDFSYLINDWVDSASNRPVFAGHGPYKSVVFEELDTQIATARSAGAAGQFFFRFDHIRSFDFGGSYPHKSLPVPMPHRFEYAAPSVATGVSVAATPASIDSTDLDLSWNPSSGSPSDPLRGYAVFVADARDPQVAAEDLTAFVWGDKVSFNERLPSSQAASRRYVVVAASRLGALSNPSAVVSAGPVGTEATADVAALRVEALWPSPASDAIRFTYRPGPSGESTVSVFDITGRRLVKRVSRTAPAQQITETLDTTGLPSGIYLLVIRSGSERASTSFVIARG